MDGAQRLRGVTGERGDRTGQRAHRIGEQFQGLRIDSCCRLPLVCAISCCLLDRDGRGTLPGVPRHTGTGVREDKPRLVKEGRSAVDERGSRERLGHLLVHGVQPGASRQPRAEDAQVSQGGRQGDGGEVMVFAARCPEPAALGCPGGITQQASQPHMAGFVQDTRADAGRIVLACTGSLRAHAGWRSSGLAFWRPPAG
jgi:hypothetical protein